MLLEDCAAALGTHERDESRGTSLVLVKREDSGIHRRDEILLLWDGHFVPVLGIILGHRLHPWHLEFTSKKGHSAGKAPTKDNLLVFYIPENEEWNAVCRNMLGAGFFEVEPFNAYWGNNGKTFEDADGYRVVLENSKWEK